MKVLILANNDIGLYNFRKELIEKLIELKYKVYVSLPYGDRVNDLINMGCEYIETDVDRRGTNPIKDFKLFCKYRKMLKDVKPDVVLTYTIKPNIYGGLCSRYLHVPYAVNVTGLGTAFQLNRLKYLIVKIYRIALKKAKVVFCENSSIGEEFVKEKIVASSKICVLNGAGVDLEKFKYLEYPDNSIVFKFLFIGRVMKEKGIDELLEATQNLIKSGVQCKLIVVGKYEEDYTTKFSRYEWLEFVGSQKDVRPFIKECHCFVLPSWHEGMANTNLECAASGRPVITSDIPGCRESVVDGVSGLLCKAKNAQSLFETMKHMTLLSSFEREKMGKEGRKHMVKYFDKRKVVDKTIKALNIE